MKVDNPRFTERGTVYCAECPFTNQYGAKNHDLCKGGDCPTAETYQAACAAADGEKGK